MKKSWRRKTNEMRPMIILLSAWRYFSDYDIGMRILVRPWQFSLNSGVRDQSSGRWALLEFAEQSTREEGNTQRESSRYLHRFVLSLLLNIKLYMHREKLCSQEKKDWGAVGRTIPKSLLVLRDICSQSRETSLNT